MEAECREPCTNHRSNPSPKVKEVDSYTQIGPTPTHASLIDAYTRSEQSGSYRQVAQGQLYTMSDSDLHLKPTQGDSEPTHPMVGFRSQQNSIQLDTQMAHPKVDPDRLQTLPGTTPPREAAPEQRLVHGDQGLPL